MEILCLWLLFALFSAWIAGKKGRSSFAWFLIGFLFGPFGLLVAFAPSIHNQQPTPKTHLKCPECAEFVLKEAKVCKHCGCRLVPELKQS